MKKNTNYRIMVLDDHEEILDLLTAVFESRGYEVLTYPHPGVFPNFGHDSCSCPNGQSCTDIILTDINMPVMGGIDFIEEQLNKGCHCRHVALMSGDYTSDDMKRADKLGLKFFRKPFSISEVFAWLDDIEKKICPARRLTQYTDLVIN